MAVLRTVKSGSEGKSEKTGRKMSRYNLRRGERDWNLIGNKNKYL